MFGSFDMMAPNISLDCFSSIALALIALAKAIIIDRVSKDGHLSSGFFVSISNHNNTCNRGYENRN